MTFNLPKDFLTPAAAVTERLTVGEVLDAKLTEVAGLCKTTAATSPLEQKHIYWLIEQVAKDFPAAILGGLIALVPPVEHGETGQAYGERLLQVITHG